MKKLTLPTIEPMENFPKNSNPFKHDLFRMGKHVSGAWMAMFTEHGGLKQEHSFTPEDKERKAAGELVFYDDPDEIVMVNQKTGQRFRIVFGD